MEEEKDVREGEKGEREEGLDALDALDAIDAINGFVKALVNIERLIGGDEFQDLFRNPLKFV